MDKGTISFEEAPLMFRHEWFPYISEIVQIWRGMCEGVVGVDILLMRMEQVRAGVTKDDLSIVMSALPLFPIVGITGISEILNLETNS